MTWKYLEKISKELFEKIVFSPDIIVAVARGGVIPARLLATHLQIKDMYCLTFKKNADKKDLTSSITEDINGKKVLLVEDSLETGRTLILAKKYLESKGAIVKTTCFYFTPKSEIIPDFFLKKVNKIPEFPWENLK